MQCWLFQILLMSDVGITSYRIVVGGLLIRGVPKKSLTSIKILENP